MTDPKSEPSELKPCPFCGGDKIEVENKHNHLTFVECLTCYATGDSVKRWQSRAALTPAPAQPEPTQEAADALWAKADEIRAGILERAAGRSGI